MNIHTVSYYLEQYWQEHTAKNTTRISCERARVLSLKTSFGHLMPMELHEPSVIETWLEDRAAGRVTYLRDDGKPGGGKKCSPAGARRELAVLIASLNYAVKRKKNLDANNRPYIKLPDASAPRDHWMTHEDAQKLLDAAQPIPAARLTRAYRAIACMLFTGARKEAVNNLTWDRIHYNPVKTERGMSYGYVDFREPSKKKSRKRRAIAPILADFAPTLERAMKERLPGSVHFLDTPADYRKTVYTATQRAGLTGVYRTTEVSHLLRHTFATWAAMDDVPMQEIAAALGDTIETTERTYAKFSPSYMQKVANRATGMRMLQV